MPTLETSVARRLTIRGRVQGVGFRPAAYRLATSLHLNGWVLNDGNGVLIHIEGREDDVAAFTSLLPKAIPSQARVEAIADVSAACEHVDGFCIRTQAVVDAGSISARVPEDRALCADCRQEVLHLTDRRYRHPFASCIQCGPRFSILGDIPYERRHTAMADFRMCSRCAGEYADPADRRFHAEPIACPDCGPRLILRGAITPADPGDWGVITAAANALSQGQIVALKGLGGYQLLVRADDDAAVARLRSRKRRPTKPFAVMVRSLEEAKRIARISLDEESLLSSAENPIVLLRSRNRVAEAVAPGLRRIGVLLPTTPLHLLLLSQLAFPIVATSGNQTEEPIAIDEIGRDHLATIADVFLDHDRPIVRRVDDSVVRLVDATPMTIRLARGIAPLALPALERWAADSVAAIPPMIALGGQQKNAVALWTGAQAILGPHLGDMNHPEARRAFSCAVGDLARLYRCVPSLNACDLHPDYFTTHWAESAGLPLFQVQHHHAHAVASMVEHGLLERDVTGVIFDGTGFGTDGTIWGGEILHATMSEYQRLAALDLFALPGGEAAIREPYRTALGVLVETFGADGIPAWLLDRLGLCPKSTAVLLGMIKRGIHAPRTSSAGRLFDAAAALLLRIRGVSYEGEAAILLEDIADTDEESAYLIEVSTDQQQVRRGDWRPLVRQLVADIAGGVAAGVCAARFQNALARWAARVASSAPWGDVVLSGGCFQNALLTRRTRASLERLGKKVHVPGRIPANDGGLAVGQLAVAMAHWRRRQSEEEPCVSVFPVGSSNDAR